MEKIGLIFREVIELLEFENNNERYLDKSKLYK